MKVEFLLLAGLEVGIVLAMVVFSDGSFGIDLVFSWAMR